MYKILLAGLMVSLLFTGCGKPKPEPIIKPAWINKPTLDGKTGAVGSARPHVKGKAEQRRLAISRGLDELSFQSGMSVGTQITRKEQQRGRSGSTSSQLFTVQTSDNKTIYAHIEEVWEHPRTEELFVWLVVD